MDLEKKPHNYERDFWMMIIHKINYDIKNYKHVEIRQIHALVDLLLFCELPDKKIMQYLYDFVTHKKFV